MAFSLRVCLLLITLFSGVYSAHAKSDPIVTGVIHDPTGSSVEFATVAIHRAKDSVVVKTEFSDATGTFRFDRLPTGNYFITASQVGLSVCKRRRLLYRRSIRDFRLFD